MMRADEHNNPTAFTVDLAIQARLKPGVDYVAGKPFPPPSVLVTAKLLGDPVAITIRLIDAVGYHTLIGRLRWNYIAIPRFVWDSLSLNQKRDVIGYHYQREGGTQMRNLFPNYGKL